MNTIQVLQKKVVNFRDKRNWKQFHNPKDAALSLTLEVAELLEHFQWKTVEEIEEYLKKNKDRVAEELSDVLYWVLLIGHDLKIDLVKAFNKKMRQNEKKYPIRKSKNSHKKYTDYK